MRYVLLAALLLISFDEIRMRRFQSPEDRRAWTEMRETVLPPLHGRDTA